MERYKHLLKSRLRQLKQKAETSALPRLVGGQDATPVVWDLNIALPNNDGSSLCQIEFESPLAKGSSRVYAIEIRGSIAAKQRVLSRLEILHGEQVLRHIPLQASGGGVRPGKVTEGVPAGERADFFARVGVVGLHLQ